MTNISSPVDPGLPAGGRSRNFNRLLISLLVALAAFALGQALQTHFGSYSLGALGWLSTALLCAILSVALWRVPIRFDLHILLWVVLVAGLAWEIFQTVVTIPGIYILPAYLPRLWRFQIWVGLAGVCALLSLAPNAWFSVWVRRGLIATTFFSAFVAGIWLIRAAPNPHIDVYVFQQTSNKALLHAQNPYTQTPPNIYGNSSSYGPKWVNKDGTLAVGNPYPPLNVYFSFVSYAFSGDLRYGYLIAILLAGVLMATLTPGRLSLLAAYIFLFSPRLFFVVEQSWTEPMVLFLAVAVVWCAFHRPAWRFVVLGLLMASKQYMIFLFPLIILLIPPKSSRRFWAQAGGSTVGVAFAVTAPLAFWNFPAFFWNVGLAQWDQVFRMDALSYAVWFTRMFGQIPPQFLSFIVLAVVLILMMRFAARTPAGFAIATALCLGLFFAFSKQAFCNYYFLVVGLLCCALAALPASENSVPKVPDKP